MTGLEVLTHVRGLGVRLEVDDGRLRTRAPRGVVTSDVEALLREHKPELLRILAGAPIETPAPAPANSPSPPPTPAPDLEALVNRVGERMRWLEEHAHEVDGAAWTHRRDAVLANHQELDAALAATGLRIEDFGWTITGAGSWYRLGHAPVVVPDRCPAEAILLETMRRAADLEADGHQADATKREAIEALLDEYASVGDVESLKAAAETYLLLFDADTAPVPQGLVVSAEVFPQIIAALQPAEFIALDLETTALSPRHGRIRLVSLASAAGCWLVDCFAVDPRPLLEVLFEKLFVAHNAVFDVEFLLALGFQPEHVACTMVLSQLLHAGEGPQVKHSLQAVVERHLGKKVAKDLQKSNWAGPLSPEQLEYARQDVLLLLELYPVLRMAVEVAKLENAAQIEADCLPAIAWLENAGVGFDAEPWAVLTAEAQAEVKELEEKLNATAPPVPGVLFDDFGRNWNSPDQVLEAFRLAGVILPDTTDATLAKVDHPLGALMRRHRTVQKRISAYGGNWLEMVENGRIYAEWKQIGADSGRMACRKPGLQQVPRDPRYRRCIQAPPGRVLVKVDYSQVELRVAAKVTGDRNMLAAYQRGEDLHTLTARLMLGRDFADAAEKKEMRQRAKAVNFGMLFGMMPPGLRSYARTQYGVELTLDEATKYRATFFQSYPDLARWQGTVSARRAKETRTLSGRRRILNPQTPDTQRLNTPIQGSAADGLKRALALLWQRRREHPSAFPVIACHDEIVVECDEQDADAVVEWVSRAMVEGIRPLLDPVPVLVEPQVSRTWAG